VSARRIKGTRLEWNTSETARQAAAVLAASGEIAELLDLVRMHAKCCAICDGPPTEFGVYTASLEEFLRWRIGRFGVALCSACIDKPQSKIKLKERFEKLAALAGLSYEETRSS
jgi:hypothetical protein